MLVTMPQGLPTYTQGELEAGEKASTLLRTSTNHAFATPRFSSRLHASGGKYRPRSPLNSARGPVVFEGRSLLGQIER